jgi:hypothetical protein
MITAVQYVHESGLLHLDIKPARPHAARARAQAPHHAFPPIAHAHCASFAGELLRGR